MACSLVTHTESIWPQTINVTKPSSTGFTTKQGTVCLTRPQEAKPLPNQLGGLGEHREHPQRGPGRKPGRQRIFGIHFWHFGPQNISGRENSVTLRPNKASFSSCKNPLNRRLRGACPHHVPPPSGYAPGWTLSVDERYDRLANDRSVWTLELCCVQSTVSPSSGH